MFARREGLVSQHGSKLKLALAWFTCLSRARTRPILGFSSLCDTAPASYRCPEGLNQQRVSENGSLAIMRFLLTFHILFFPFAPRWTTSLELLAGAPRRRLRASQTMHKHNDSCVTGDWRWPKKDVGSGRSAFQGWGESRWLSGETFARITAAHSTMFKRQRAADDGETVRESQSGEASSPPGKCEPSVYKGKANQCLLMSAALTRL